MSIKDVPSGLISTVKDVLNQNQDLYGDDLRRQYSIPETPSPEPEEQAPEVPETPADTETEE